MRKFTHYLVTRFNVPLEGLGPETVKARSLPPSWLQDRMILFERFCAPSVSGQSNLHFTWLIYCAADTSPDILDRIQDAVKPEVSLQLRQVENYKDLIQDLKRLCASTTTPFVMTTRLDNDDGIGEHFIDQIQSSFIEQNKTVINLLGGIKYDLGAGVISHMRHSLRNPFTTLIESHDPGEPFETILGFHHLYPGSHLHYINVKHPYGFWMNIHPQNAAPRLINGRPRISKSVCAHYHLDTRHVPFSLVNTIRYTLKWFPRAAWRKFLFLVKTKILASSKNGNL